MGEDAAADAAAGFKNCYVKGEMVCGEKFLSAGEAGGSGTDYYYAAGRRDVWGDWTHCSLGKKGRRKC